MAFLPKDLFAQNNEWFTNSLKKILGGLFWVEFIFTSPYLLGEEYFQKRNIAFNPQVWNTIGMWVGGFFIAIILILLLGKLLNWLHFRFSNLLTRGFQKFAQHCITRNKEMPLGIFITEISIFTVVITIASIVIKMLV